MSNYTSKTRRGFFSDEICGTPTIRVLDPNWVRPTRTVTLQPGESVVISESPHQVVTNDTADLMEVPDVPDMTVEHPTIEVSNPDCRLPSDARPISEQLRAELLAAPYGINWDTEPPEPAGVPTVSPAAAWAAHQAQAQALINTTDAEIVAACEALILGEQPTTDNIKLARYRRSLRAIVAAPQGDPTAAMPTRD